MMWAMVNDKAFSKAYMLLRHGHFHQNVVLLFSHAMTVSCVCAVPYLDDFTEVV